MVIVLVSKGWADGAALCNKVEGFRISPLCCEHACAQRGKLTLQMATLADHPHANCTIPPFKAQNSSYRVNSEVITVD